MRPSSRSASPPRPCRSPSSRISPIPAWRRRSRRSQGVGLVSVSGGQRPAVRVQWPTCARSPPTGSTSMTCAPPSATPTSTRPRARSMARRAPGRINANDQIQSPDAYKSIIVAYKNGNPVRLSDVAEVIAGAENTYLAGWVNNTPGIILNVQRQPGANVIQVVDRIKQLLPALHGHAARGRRCRGPHRPHQHHPRLGARCRVRAGARRGAGGAGDFPVPAQHRRPRSSRACSVPLSLVGTLGVMYLLGFSLNNLSLMALTIATGFVVDDAIVMIENISRYIEEGDDAARGGAQGCGRDRLHHRVAHRLADRGADPAALHGRCGRAAVPRIRHHARGHHRHLGRRLAHPRADDVRASCCGTRRRSEETRHRALVEREVSGAHRPLRRRRSVGARSPAADPAGGARHAGSSPSLLYVFIPKGFFPVQDTGLIQAITEAPQSVSYARHGRSARSAWRRRSSRTRTS